MTSIANKSVGPNPTIHLFLDFDGTLTEKDTLHLVAHAGYDLQQRNNRLPPPTPWIDIVDAYTADYKAHSESYSPAKAQRSTIHQEIAWLRSLQEVEEASAQRVFAAGVFDNLSYSEIINAVDNSLSSQNVRMRNGWNDLLSCINNHNTGPGIQQSSPSIEILSVNWSASFVERVIIQSACSEHVDYKHTTLNTTSNTIPQPPWLSNLKVYANEIPSINPPSPSRINAVPMRTSGDKVRQFHACCSPFVNTTTRSIYIGDSTTDLECLVAADTGICIRDDPSGSSQQDLAETCERMGIQVSRISRKEGLDRVSGRLWWARDFVEVKEWIEDIIEG